MTSGWDLPNDAHLVVTEKQVSADLDGEAAILSMKDGVYYGLDPVGSRVWHLLAEPKTFDELCAAVLAEYEVEEEQLRADLGALLRDLLDRGLIEVDA